MSELRAAVFCRELRWAGLPSDTEERDDFDVDSTPIAVLDGHGDVIGTVRLIGPQAPWMLDSVFSQLAPEQAITKSSDTAEASRLAVHPRWRGKRLRNGIRVCDLVYKATYAYCRLRGIRHLYMVTSDIVLTHMQRSGLPCREITPAREMPDGVRAGAAVVDWNGIRQISRGDWYESGWQAARPDAAFRPAVAAASRVHGVTDESVYCSLSAARLDRAPGASGSIAIAQ